MTSCSIQYFSLKPAQIQLFQQMNLPVLPSILLVISSVHAFQYTELAQYVDSHQEEYVEVQCISSIFLLFSNMFKHPCTGHAGVYLLYLPQRL